MLAGPSPSCVKEGTRRAAEVVATVKVRIIGGKEGDVNRGGVAMMWLGSSGTPSPRNADGPLLSFSLVSPLFFYPLTRPRKSPAAPLRRDGVPEGGFGQRRPAACPDGLVVLAPGPVAPTGIRHFERVTWNR